LDNYSATADIESLYPSLPLKVCKSQCLSAYEQYKNYIDSPTKFSSQQIQKILSWALDYNFVEFKGSYYEQHSGIPMGSNSSVSVSNITVAREIHSLFNKHEIEFRERFIDDIFLIIDITDILNVDEYLQQMFIHSFLKFTYEYSESNVNFLDLNVTINSKNEIETSIYRKPVSKHQYLHPYSNHPQHVFQSLPYSAGLRILKCTSNETQARIEIDNEMNKFIIRGYKKHIINKTILKLNDMTREEILKPKSTLLLNNLRIHNPNILDKYNINVNTYNNVTKGHTIFITVPFYKNICNLDRVYVNEIRNILGKCKDQRYKEYLQSLVLRVAFSKTNSLTSYLRK